MRFEDFLAHHGIPGQKWGVRRFQNRDGSLTDAGKAARKFNRNMRKLERLQKKTDVSIQNQNAKKYGKRALIGAGISAASALGSLAIKNLSPNGFNRIRGHGDPSNLTDPTMKKLISDSSGQDFRIAAGGALGAAAIVSAGYSIVNGILAGKAKMRTTSFGHKRAIKKYKRYSEKMIKKYSDTPYSELIRW